MDLKLEEKIRHECTVERVDASRSDPLAYSYAMTKLSMLSRRLRFGKIVQRGKKEVQRPSSQYRLTFPDLIATPDNYGTPPNLPHTVYLDWVQRRNHLLLLFLLLLCLLLLFIPLLPTSPRRVKDSFL